MTSYKMISVQQFGCSECERGMTTCVNFPVLMRIQDQHCRAKDHCDAFGQYKTGIRIDRIPQTLKRKHNPKSQSPTFLAWNRPRRCMLDGHARVGCNPRKKVGAGMFPSILQLELYRHLITYARVLVPDEGELNVAVVVQTRNGGVELPKGSMYSRAGRSVWRGFS